MQERLRNCFKEGGRSVGPRLYALNANVAVRRPACEECSLRGTLRDRSLVLVLITLEDVQEKVAKELVCDRERS